MSTVPVITAIIVRISKTAISKKYYVTKFCSVCFRSLFACDFNGSREFVRLKLGCCRSRHPAAILPCPAEARRRFQTDKYSRTASCIFLDVENHEAEYVRRVAAMPHSTGTFNWGVSQNQISPSNFCTASMCICKYPRPSIRAISNLNGKGMCF